MANGVVRGVILVALCCLSYGGLSEGKHGKQVQSAFIIGTVRDAGNFISGASIVLECGDGISLKAKTDEHGDFRVSFPASDSKHFKRFKACSVKLISSTEPDCQVSSTISTTLIQLNSRKHKKSPRIFSTGLLKFNPSKRPIHCIKKREEITFSHAKHTQQLIPKLKQINEEKIVPGTLFFPFPFPFPPNPLNPPVLPPNPLLPPPSIFPPIPGITPPPSGILPPVPGLTPPPSGILPPIPVLTTPPPPSSIFPPIPGIPTIPTIPTIPGIPALASPPPPPPPSLLPPFPFPPGFPGIPPADSKSSSKP